MSEVLTQAENGVLIITINRPEAKNAVNQAVAKGLAAAMEQLDSDKSLNVGIITGAGGTFCSGMDLKAFLRGELPSIKGKGFAGFIESPPAKPLIGAVQGYALAGGMEIAIACDLLVANDKAQFGITEVKRSLVAAAGGLLTLPSIIGKRMAMELALTGDFISAQRAYEVGFVNRITDGAAIDAALELAAIYRTSCHIVTGKDQLLTLLGARAALRTELGQSFALDFQADDKVVIAHESTHLF